MSPNDPNRPEDNPFTAFRRFADSQVSSLLNTVFTLPATISNYNNAHIAREQCLFGRADPASCEKLAHLESQITDLRSEGRELYRVGDLQAMVQKGQMLMEIDRQAEDLRRDIVESARSRGDMVKTTPKIQIEEAYNALLGGKHETDEKSREKTGLVEKVANEKGQEWGWMWDWGFPRPFDADDNATEDGSEPCRWRHRRQQMIRERDEQRALFDARWENLRKMMDEETPHHEGKPKVYRWSFQWPPAPTKENEKDTSQVEVGKVQAEAQSLFDEVARMFDSPWYSPEALEKDEDLKRAGVNWRDAYQDLIPRENGSSLIPSTISGAQKNKPYNERDEYAQWVAPRAQSQTQQQPQSSTAAELQHEDISYEYSHDHEDQHDEPPSPKPKQSRWSKDMPETELDAYELMLGRAYHASGASTAEADQSRILSTLSTTERSIGPDGTVTTKVVFKKRFADGTEESSETVHTQRRGNDDVREQHSQSHEVEPKVKKTGWFWSS